MENIDAFNISYFSLQEVHGAEVTYYSLIPNSFYFGTQEPNGCLCLDKRNKPTGQSVTHLPSPALVTSRRLLRKQQTWYAALARH